MNTIELQYFSPEERAFIEAAQRRLRGSESLTYVESARLAATRAQIRELVSRPAPTRSSGWTWLAAPAAIAAVVFSVTRFHPADLAPPAAPTADVLEGLASDVNAHTTAALVWVSDEAGPDFYRDLEFYEWLQKQRSPTEPNA